MVCKGLNNVKIDLVATSALFEILLTVVAY